MDEKTAFRGGLLLNFASASTATKVAAIPATTPASFVDDVAKVSTSNIGLTFGLEKRKGKTRLQGFYGAELGVMVGTAKTSNECGNALSADNPVFRAAESKLGSVFGLGLRGFIGAEYFILPKMSIGAEFGWGLAYTRIGEGEATVDAWDGTKVVST
ncbi:MAG: hypothetical protein ACO3EE_10675, partial [Flavobacteriales bacterium]